MLVSPTPYILSVTEVEVSTMCMHMYVGMKFLEV